MASEGWYKWQSKDQILNLKVSAGASADEFAGQAVAGTGGPWLRARVAAPPIDGKADEKATLRFDLKIRPEGESIFYNLEFTRTWN